MNASFDGNCCRVGLIAAVGGLAVFVPNSFAQQTAATGTTEAQRVIATGSNTPTAEEVGPNPADTYRPADIEKLGIRNPTDLTTFLPQQSGATTNLNMANGVDGTVQFNLRGLLVNHNSGN
jgi:hypothetical protein